MDFSEMNLQYTQEQLDELEKIEEELVFEHFDSHDALRLGNLLIKLTKKYDGELAVIITREDDQTVVFQHVMNTKSERNLQFAQMKRNTVLETGHCSFWKLVHGIVHGQSPAELFSSGTSVPAGGAFPIIVNGEVTYTAAVSGLHNGDDQRILTEALSEYLHRENIVFHGTIL